MPIILTLCVGIMILDENVNLVLEIEITNIKNNIYFLLKYIIVSLPIFDFKHD